MSSKYHALNHYQKILVINGFPLKHMCTEFDITKFGFDNLGHNKIIIDVLKQANALSSLDRYHDKIGFSSLYAMAHSTNPDHIRKYLCSLGYKYAMTIPYGLPKIKWFDLGSMDFEYLKSDENPAMVVIDGLTDFSEARRMELASDLVRKYSESTVFLVLSTKNVLSYCLDKISVQPNAVWQVVKTTNRRVV